MIQTPPSAYVHQVNSPHNRWEYQKKIALEIIYDIEALEDRIFNKIEVFENSQHFLVYVFQLKKVREGLMIQYGFPACPYYSSQEPNSRNVELPDPESEE